MTVIIPYKKEPVSDIELLYALRSIDKYLIGFTNLIILGTPPDWYKGESVYVQDRGEKQFNIYQKLLVACSLKHVTNSFIEWDDDVMLNEIMDLWGQSVVCHGLTYYQDGLLIKHSKKDMGLRYREAVSNTIRRFPEGKHFDLHNPIVYNKEQFKKLFANEKQEIIIKSTYCNTYGIEGVHRDDCKLQQILSKEAIKERIKGRLFFSTSTNAMKKPMIELLSELYPNKSRWEK